METPKTYRLVRISDLLDLNERQMNDVLRDLPDLLRTVRATREAISAIAESMGTPCPPSALVLPHVDWVDDGKRDVSIVLRGPSDDTRPAADGGTTLSD